MASRREQILAAVAAALGGAGKPASFTAHRHRTRPLDADQLPAGVVYPAPSELRSGGTEVAERVTLQPFAVGRKLRVRVELRAVASGSDAPETAVDPYYVWAVQSVLADETFGGLAIQAREVSVQYEAMEADEVFAACAVDFEIEYETLDGHPESAP